MWLTRCVGVVDIEWGAVILTQDMGGGEMSRMYLTETLVCMKGAGRAPLGSPPQTSAWEGLETSLNPYLPESPVPTTRATLQHLQAGF